VEPVQPASLEKLTIAFLGAPPHTPGELFHGNIFDVLDNAPRAIHDFQAALPNLEAQIEILVTLEIVLVESTYLIEQRSLDQDAAADINLALARFVDSIGG